MPDHYYLESEIFYIDGKKKNTNYKLYNHGDYIKTFSKEESKVISKRIKDENITRKMNGNMVTIDNQRFVIQMTRLNLVPKKRNIINKRLIAVLIAGTLTASIGLLKTGKKTDINNQSIVHASDLNDDIIIDDSNDTESETVEKEEIVNDIKDTYTPTKTTIDLTNYDEQSNTKYNEELEDKDMVPELISFGDDFENIFEFSYEDRSSNQNVSTVNDNYLNIINTYSSRYGIDPKIMFAIICQENPNNIKNYNMVAGHGVPQIEGIWDNSEVYAYNFETNQTESSGPIDVMRCVDDQDYSIKISCMIMSSYYNTIHTNYSDKLNPEQELGATIWAYNKGITQICKSLNNTDNYNEFVSYVKNYTAGGDNEYIEHVLSYIQDEDVVYLKSKDGLINSVMIDNTSVENIKKPIL